jgi:hypothetical protein
MAGIKVTLVCQLEELPRTIRVMRTMEAVTTGNYKFPGGNGFQSLLQAGPSESRVLPGSRLQ